jgi:hypothetical protein
MIQKTGVKALTVHGRTVDNSKLYTGACDWDIIRDIKAELDIPVIANGGVGSRADALACLDHTGADAVMSSEALLENPKLFSESGDAAFQACYARTQLQTAEEYLATLHSHRLPGALHQVVRGHLFKLLYRFVDAPKNADLREILSRGHLAEMSRVLPELHRRIAPHGWDDAQLEQAGLLNDRTWYWRHRGVGAEERRLSNRRKYFQQALPPSARGNRCESTEEVLEKTQALKARLLAKRESQSLVQ